ncbi:MAG: hypothetical protein IH903_03015 [Proteobacteria bacterium]|nr:hypothetical protein [Pseudomonadota bacterium]
MTTETLQEAAAEQIQAAVKTGKENLDKAVAAGTEALTAGYDQALALSREQVEKLFPAASTGFDQAAGFQKQNLEALVAAAGGRARRYLAMSFPRDRWWLRLLIRAANLWYGLRRIEFRVYVHSPSAILAVAQALGVRPVLRHEGAVWQVAVLERSS